MIRSNLKLCQHYLKTQALMGPHIFLTVQLWARSQQWRFLLWPRASRGHWPARLLVSALDLILKSPGCGQKEERMSLTLQETYLLRRWLRSHGKWAQVGPSTHWLNLMTPMSPVQFATGTTLQHLRLLLWMWHVSSFPLSFSFLPESKLISITQVSNAVILFFRC